MLLVSAFFWVCLTASFSAVCGTPSLRVRGFGAGKYDPCIVCQCAQVWEAPMFDHECFSFGIDSTSHLFDTPGGALLANELRALEKTKVRKNKKNFLQIYR